MYVLYYNYKKEGDNKMKFIIYIENRMIAEVSGMDFAYEVYAKAVMLAEMIGEIASLVDGNTGEIIISSDDYY